MKVKQNQQGFTLIELMIVVAIIGILAAVAIPSYRDYTARAQMSEALSLASGFKTGLAEYYQSEGGFTTALKATQFGATLSGKYVSNVELKNANASYIDIVVTMKSSGSGVASEIAGKELWLSASDGVDGSGGRNWICNSGGSGLSARHLPASCR